MRKFIHLLDKCGDTSPIQRIFKSTYLQIISSPFHQASRDANESAKTWAWLLSGSRKIPAYLHPEMVRIVKWPSSRPLWVGSVAIQMFSRFFLWSQIRGILQHDFTTWKDVCVYKWRLSKVGVPLNHPFSIGIFHERNHPAIVPLWLWKPPNVTDLSSTNCHQTFCGKNARPGEFLWVIPIYIYIYIDIDIICTPFTV